MSVRAIQVRIECDRESVQNMWRTHRIFNEKLPSVINAFFRMRRGEIGESTQRRKLASAFIEGVLLQDAKNAYDRILKAQNSSPKNGTAKKALAPMAKTNASLSELQKSYEEAFDEFVSGWRPLSFLRDILAEVPMFVTVKLYQEAVMVISGHDELLKLWKTKHAEWLAQKSLWETQDEHKKYLSLRHRFESFESEVGGKISKRRGRWHLYLEWLTKNPDLAAWRGGEAVIHKLDAAMKARIAKSRPSKQRGLEAEEFWKLNPELKALDRLHGDYEKKFVRRRKTKKNVDGFDHPPTFTLPHAVNHPRWFVFNAPQTQPTGYDNLKIPNSLGERGSIELLLITGERQSDGFPSKRTTVSFMPDPRLLALQPTKVRYTANRGKDKGIVAQKDGYQFYDRHLKKYRTASVSGAKLMFRGITLNSDGTLKNGVPYLVFTVNVDDEPLTESAKATKLVDTSEITKKGKVRKKRAFPDALITCAVDLGVRHLGFATVAKKTGDSSIIVLRSRNLWLQSHAENGTAHPVAGPDLAHIGHHKRNIRRLRRLRGKPVKNESTHVRLQEHIDDMASDRFKKGARAIINFALNLDGKIDKKTGHPYPRADVIVLENLETLIPDAEKERGINRMLVAFNRGNLVSRIKEMAEDAGLKVWEVNPIGTSQVCSRCGALGRRYSIQRDEESGKPDIKFGEVEKLFACPNSKCDYRANADHNASVNLHRRFFLDDAAVDAWRAVRATDQSRREALRKIEDTLREPLRRMHNVNQLETPF